MIFPTLILCLSLALCYCEQIYMDRIPNGHSVPDPCTNGGFMWQGVGHLVKAGGGKRNYFGKDFASAGHVWTNNLCMNDSDGDGQSNGVELGDPLCQWSFNSTNAQKSLQLATGHPGICEPVTDPKCVTINQAIGVVCHQR